MTKMSFDFEAKNVHPQYELLRQGFPKLSSDIETYIIDRNYTQRHFAVGQ